MARHITVKPGDKLQPGEVALWEVHPDHPDGEVMISAPHPGEEAKSFRVARTPEVSARLGDGRLMQPGRSQPTDDDEEDAPAEPESSPAAARGRRAVGQSEA